MNTKLEPLLQLLGLIRSVMAFGRQHAALLDVYEDNIYRALAHLLSAFGALCMDPDLLEEQPEDTPYHDFGPEPVTREEALAKLHDFLEQVGRFLHEQCDVRDLPLGIMHIRAGTFAFFLAEGEQVG